MKDLQIVALTPLSQLEDELVFQLSQDDLLLFILGLDAGVADYEFTQKLILKLRKTLEDEGEIPLSEQLFELRENIAAASQRVGEASALLTKMELDNLE